MTYTMEIRTLVGGITVRGIDEGAKRGFIGALSAQEGDLPPAMPGLGVIKAQKPPRSLILNTGDGTTSVVQVAHIVQVVFMPEGGEALQPAAN